MQAQRGFSLIELVVSITILVVLAGISTPLLTRFLQNSRISATANDFLSMVNLARGESIRRNTRVTLCGLGADRRCLSAAGDSTAFEANGWAVFEDGPVGPSTMLGATAPTTQLVRIQAMPKPGILVRANFGYITFTPMGQARTDNTSADKAAAKVCRVGATSTACDTAMNVRCIVVSSAGSPSIVDPKTAPGTANAGVTGSGGCVE